MVLMHVHLQQVKICVRAATLPRGLEQAAEQMSLRLSSNQEPTLGQPVLLFWPTPMGMRLNVLHTSVPGRVTPALRRWCGRSYRSLPSVKMSTAAVSTEVAPPGLLLQANIWEGVLRTYDLAQASGAATKTETQTEVVQDAVTGLSWVIRLASALKSKPTGPATSSSGGNDSKSGESKGKAPWRNPFLPPDPELTVGHLSSTHTLVLNKFNVVAHHCLVITKAFESQADPLNARDLEATWKLLQVMPSGGLAFYNCGPASGRSQPHKHVQVVPLPFAPELPAQAPIHPALQAAADASKVLPFQPYAVRQLPWQCYAAQLLPSSSPEELELAFTGVLAAARQGWEAAKAVKSQGGTQTREEQEPFSYNVLLTQSHVVVVPRMSEVCGPLAVNSLGFAGTILVKDEDGAAFIKSQGPAAVLTSLGCSWA